MTNDRYAQARVEAEPLVRAGHTYEQIAAKVGVSASSVRSWAKLYDWPRGPVSPLRPIRAIANGPAGPAVQRQKRKNSEQCPVDRAELIRRLYAAIESNLKDLEQRMTDDILPSAAEGERDARTLSTAIRNLEKVTELEAGTERDADTAARKRGGTPTADDEHRLRLEIAERILRIQEQQRRLQP